MALPCALFSSSTENHKPEDFVRKILKVSVLPQPDLLNDGIKGYEWSFETKYYTATIHLCTTHTRTIGDQEFANNMQAFIHAFNPNEPESFEYTKAWLPYLNHIEPVVQILVCDTSKHCDAIDRKNVLQWCVEHGFELVELSPEEDSDDEENDFPETTGMERIVQALHAHTWSNLEMKDNPTVQSPYLRQMMKEQLVINQLENRSLSNSHPLESVTDESKCSKPSSACATSSSTGEENVKEQTVESKTAASGPSSETSLEPKETDRDVNGTPEIDSVDWKAFVGAEDSSINGDETSVEEFEQLFERLKFMKDKAETLSPDERKKYAEKVALSFWKAIGGDEEEVAGLDLDSD